MNLIPNRVSTVDITTKSRGKVETRSQKSKQIVTSPPAKCSKRLSSHKPLSEKNTAAIKEVEPQQQLNYTRLTKHIKSLPPLQGLLLDSKKSGTTQICTDSWSSIELSNMKTLLRGMHREKVSFFVCSTKRRDLLDSFKFQMLKISSELAECIQLGWGVCTLYLVLKDFSLPDNVTNTIGLAKVCSRSVADADNMNMVRMTLLSLSFIDGVDNGMMDSDELSLSQAEIIVKNHVTALKKCHAKPYFKNVQVSTLIFIFKSK